MSHPSRYRLSAAVVAGLFLSACAPALQTKVVTLSDRAPVATSTYHIELSDEQRGDLEAARVASQVHSRMTRAGFVRVEEPADARLRVSFVLSEDGPVASHPADEAGLSASRGASVRSSQTRVGGIPVPGTRTTSVSRQAGHGVSTGSAHGGSSWRHGYRFELMLVDDQGPSHKVTVSATSTPGRVDELAPCLVEAAFEDFPLGDRQERVLRVDPRTCAG